MDLATEDLTCNELSLSDHAIGRCHERDYSEREIQFIMTYGRKRYFNGTVHYEMLKKNMPGHISPNDKRHQRLIGTTVVLNLEETVVVTVYWNSSFKNKNSKANYDFKRRRSQSRYRGNNVA